MLDGLMGVENRCDVWEVCVGDAYIHTRGSRSCSDVAGENSVPRLLFHNPFRTVKCAGASPPCPQLDRTACVGRRSGDPAVRRHHRQSESQHWGSRSTIISSSAIHPITEGGRSDRIPIWFGKCSRGDHRVSSRDSVRFSPLTVRQRRKCSI